MDDRVDAEAPASNRKSLAGFCADVRVGDEGPSKDEAVPQEAKEALKALAEADVLVVEASRAEADFVCRPHKVSICQ